MKTTIIYHQVYQKFTELDEQGNIVKEGSFRIPERVEKVLENDHATIVFLSDGSKGVALCHPNDVWNMSFGRKLSYLRAKLISIQKEIKEVIKSSCK